jgi:hypothetical protein
MTVELERSLYALADEFLSDVKSRNPKGLNFDAAVDEFKQLAVTTGAPKDSVEDLVRSITPEPEVPEFIRPGLVLQSCLTFLLGQPLVRRGHSREIADLLVYKFLRAYEQELAEKHGFWP